MAFLDTARVFYGLSRAFELYFKQYCIVVILSRIWNKLKMQNGFKWQLTYN